jgi:hypothetical protein
MTISLDSELEVEFPDWPQLVGRQTPEYLLCDDGDQSAADGAVALAARIQRPQMPWQENTLRGILTLKPDGTLMHPTAVIVCPRQNGKTLSAAELRIVYGAFQRHETIVYTAQRWMTAKAIYLRVKQLINSRPSLKRRVFGWTCSQGAASFSVRHDDGTESTALFITRSGDFRGPDGVDLVVYDEAYNLTDAEMAAISPTQLAAADPQTVYLSSAVNQEIHPNGRSLAGIRRRALEAIELDRSAQGLYYAEYMAPLPPEGISEAERRAFREDPATWRAANPSYGVIQSEAKVRKLLTELSPKAFEVECLGWGDWPVDGDGERPLGRDRWLPLAGAPALVRSTAATIGIDRDPMTREWSISGAQRSTDGRIHAEIGWRGKTQPTEVIARLMTIIGEVNPDAIALAGDSPATVLVPLLNERGIEPVLMNLTDRAIACEGLLEAAIAAQLSHSDQRFLNDSAFSAIKRELSGKRFVWDKATGGSIVHLNAVTWAHWALLTFGINAAPPPAPLMDTKSAPDQHVSAEFDPMTAAF